MQYHFRLEGVRVTRMKVFISSVLLLLIFLIQFDETAEARILRIFPVPNGVFAVCAGANDSACDFVRAAAGFAILHGPDAGIRPLPGDTLVVATGSYILQAFAAGAPVNGTGPIVIPGTNAAPFAVVMERLHIISRSGRAVTVIEGSDLPFAAVIIGANQVKFGGDGPDQGFTVQDSNDEGIQIGTPQGGTNPFGIDLSVGIQGSRDIYIQNNFIFNNDDDGIDLNYNPPSSPKAAENIHIIGNIIRENESDGIDVNFFVIRLGGKSEDEKVFILHNTIDNNDENGIEFEHFGTQEQVFIQYNYIVRNGIDGVFWEDEVLDIEDSGFSHNRVMENNCHGVHYENTGNIERYDFTHNRTDDGTEGITGNGCAGVVFSSFEAIAFFPGLGVRDIEDLYFIDNVISENGFEEAEFVFNVSGGLIAGLEFYFDGVVFVNFGDIVRLTFSDNRVIHNAGSGVTIGLPGNQVPLPFFCPCFEGFAVPGDLEDSRISGNTLFNNGTFGSSGGFLVPHGDGFAVYIAGGITNVVFEENISTENFYHGIFLSSPQSDIIQTYFYNNYLNKNGVRANSLIDSFGVPFIGLPSADGLEISTFGDIIDFIWNGGEANGNGGNGIHLDANANSLANPFYGVGTLPFALTFPPSAIAAPNPGDIQQVSIQNAHFYENGASAPIGAGNGILAIADKLSQWDVVNIHASRNDDHGQLLTITDDLSNVSVRESMFDENGLNADSIGTGLFFDALDDMEDVMVEGISASGNYIGIWFNIKGENGRRLYVRNSEINNNLQEGILVDGSDDVSNVELVKNILMYNRVGISLKTIDRNHEVTISDNEIMGNGNTIGILLDANNVNVLLNVIERHQTGILVSTVVDNVIEQNNIANNKGYAIEAPTHSFDGPLQASNNWWGKPSGPEADGNPSGQGDEISGRVTFDPWLTEPAKLTEEDNQETINVVNISPEMTVAVACDTNTNSLIDDDEIMTCIVAWAMSDLLAGLDQAISDQQIKFIMELWILGEPIS